MAVSFIEEVPGINMLNKKMLCNLVVDCVQLFGPSNYGYLIGLGGWSGGPIMLFLGAEAMKRVVLAFLFSIELVSVKTRHIRLSMTVSLNLDQLHGSSHEDYGRTK